MTMHSRTEVAAPVQTAAALKRQLLNSGWQEGPPPRLPDVAQQTDRRVCRHMRCPNHPACKRRGLTYQPFHHPLRATYTVVASCPVCSSAEVF